MHCLYCKKRLGLFAFKKRQFCSEVHEVAYHDEQSGLAMRRVMDPLFSTPIKSPPLRTAPEASPAMEDASQTLRLLEPRDPQEGSFALKQQLPKPVAPDLSAADGPFGVERFATPFQFPSSMGGVLAFTLNSALESDGEIAAEADEASGGDTAGEDAQDVRGAHSDAPPEVFAEPGITEAIAPERGETSDVGLAGADEEAPVEVAPDSEPELAGTIAAAQNESVSFDPAANAHAAAALEIESVAGTVDLPSSGSGPDAEPELAGTLAAAQNESVSFDPAANAHAAALEIESVAGTVDLPSCGSAPGSEPELAGTIAAAQNESVSFDPAANAHAAALEIESVTGTVDLLSSGSAPGSEPGLAGTITAARNESITCDPVANAHAAAALETESLAGPVHLPSSGSAPDSEPELAGTITAARNESVSFDHAANAHVAALEIESLARPVHLPSSGSAQDSDPELAGTITAARNESIAFDPAANARAEATLETESLAGPVHLPSSGSAPNSEPELAGKISAVRNASVSFDLAANAHAEAALEIESLAGPVHLPSSGSAPNSEPELAGKISAVRNASISFDLAAKARAEATLETESLAGPVHLPSSGSAPNSEPELAGKIAAARNESISFDLAAKAQSEAALEIESLAGPVHLPSSVSAPDSEPDLAGKISAVRNAAISFDLAANARAEATLETESLARPVHLPSSGSAPDSEPELAGKITAARNESISFDLAAQGHDEATFEVESPAGQVHLPSSGGGVIAFTPVPVLEAVEENDITAPAALLPRLEQIQLMTIAEIRAPQYAAGLEPSPQFPAPSIDLAELRMKEAAPDLKVNWAPLVGLAWAGALSPNPAPWPYTCISPAAEPSLDSTLDPQRLRRRYSLANIAIAPATLEGPAEPMDGVWSAMRLGRPEGEPQASTQLREAGFQDSRSPVRMYTPVVPGAPVRGELPQVSAEPIEISPSYTPNESRTEPFRWPQAPPAVPSISSVTSFRIPFSGADAAMTLPPSPATVPGFEDAQRQDPIPLVVRLAVPVPDGGPQWSAASSRTLAHSPSHSESPSLLSEISKERSAFRADGKDRGDELRWPQAQLALPPISPAMSFRNHFVGIARAAMTLLTFPAVVPACQATPRKEPIPPVSTLAIPAPPRAGFWTPFNGRLLQSPSQVEAAPFVSAKQSDVSAAQPQRDAQTDEFRWPQARLTLPQVSSARSFGIPFAAAKPSRISSAKLQRVSQTEQFRWPQAQSVLPRACSAKSFGIPFVFAKPSRIAQAELQKVSQTEQFRWPNAQLLLPRANSAKPFGIPSVAVAKAAMTRRAFRATPPARRAISRQQPILPAVALKTPVSGCAALNRVLLQASAFLQPRGIALAARNPRLELREFSTKLYIPNAGARRSRSAPVKLALGTASSHTAAQPSAPQFRREEIRTIKPGVPFPTMPARVESFALPEALASITPLVQDHRGGRFRTFGSTGIQRFRAAAHIRIREPELHGSATGDLPALSTSLPWPGIPGALEIRLGGTPVPLRPPLQAPSLG